MKKIFTLILILLSLSLVKADYWTQKANFPGTARNLPISFAIGNTGYIGWGTDPTNMSTKDLWAYNPLTNVWTQKALFPGAARSGATSFVDPVSGKAYAGLGQNTLGTTFQDWWEYNPVSNLWTSKANFAGGPRSLAVGFYAGFYGYVGLGSNATGDQSDLWQYDPVSNGWFAKSPLPSLGRKQVSSFVIAGKAYVATGFSTAVNSPLLDLYEYDPLNDLWSVKTSFYGDARYGAAAFTCWGNGYMGTGKTILGTYATDFWQYEHYNDLWYQKSNFSGAGRFEGGAFALNDTGYIGCGGSPGSFYKDLWKYTPDTTTGIDEFSVFSSLVTVAPNPASELIVISYPALAHDKISITITNIKGEKIYSQESETENQKPGTQININNFSNGVYFIQISSGKLKTVKKILKV